MLHVQVCAYGTILYAAGPGNRNLRFCARFAYLLKKKGHMHGYSSQTQLKKDPGFFEVFKVFESVQCISTKHQSSSKRVLDPCRNRPKHFKLHLSLNELISTVQVSLHLNSFFRAIVPLEQNCCLSLGNKWIRDSWVWKTHRHRNKKPFRVDP